MAPRKIVPAPSDFAGFSEEAFRFLRGLKKNNDRDWFLPRKAIFEKQLQEPLTQVLLAIESELKKSQLPLLAKQKGMLSRIYRDVRFSANKDPYHTFLSGTLVPNGRKNAPGVLYVHVGEKEQLTGVGFWQPERPALTNWRLRMQAEPEIFLSMINQLKKKGLALDDAHRLQRMPRGFEAQDDTPIGEYLRYQSFVITRPITKAEVMSAELPHLIARFALEAKPLLEYGWKLPVQASTEFLD